MLLLTANIAPSTSMTLLCTPPALFASKALIDDGSCAATIPYTMVGQLLFLQGIYGNNKGDASCSVDVCYARMACHVWGLLLLLPGGHEDK